MNMTAAIEALTGKALAESTDQEIYLALLDIVRERGKLDLIDYVSFHPYYENPDDATPGIEALAELVAAADAAATRAEIEALDDTTFCTAYIKLLRLLKERYPDVKIVCIIGDYLSTGIERSTLAIARHYGARCVDLYAVNGFNDQTYMPKHDYNPATGKGCHPSSEAMKFIADKIYAELGSWLEE